MSAVGVFRKEERDGKRFWVFTLTQKDNSTSSGEALAMDSGGDDLPLQPVFLSPAARMKLRKFILKRHDDDDNEEEDGGDFEKLAMGDYLPLQPSFFCPGARLKFQDLKLKTDDEGGRIYELLPLNSSPHFPRTRSSEQQDDSLLDCNNHEICKLPVVHLNNIKDDDGDELECYACLHSRPSKSYYACVECEYTFHKECVESPPEIKHPSYPFLSLQLYTFPCFLKCICCGEYLTYIFYYSTTYNMGMHPVCAMEDVPIVIDHPKSHPHTLTFFPRQTSLACNICGLTNYTYPTYICTECVFVIHKNCIGFPHVIRVSRHNHRISFTSFLPSGKLSCGVCHRPVDNNFGAYSCRICDAYFVHSRCALHDDVWDGKELEGVPEEDDTIDDGEPFERIADGIIHHPSHSHHIRLENSGVYDEKEFCRGCGLPIYQGKYYSCVECDFILHESCAHAPRMKRHPLYAHPLTLNFAIEGFYKGQSFFVCDVCKAQGSGFAYECQTKDSMLFQLDLRCALVAEPFDYQGHKHPLFLALDREEQARCQICKYNGYGSKLNCMECEYSICFSCATLPYKARYKHDSHFLTICDRKEEGDQPDWCEVCEGKILVQEEEEEEEEEEATTAASVRFLQRTVLFLQPMAKEFQLFYKCDDCCVAIHVTCLLGKEMYMRPGENLFNGRFQILLNNSLSRPFCRECMRRCPFPIYYREYKFCFCTASCAIKHSH